MEGFVSSPKINPKVPPSIVMDMDRLSKLPKRRSLNTSLYLVEVTQIIGFIEVAVFALALPSCKVAYDNFKERQEELEKEAMFDKAFIEDYLRREKRGKESPLFKK